MANLAKEGYAEDGVSGEVGYDPNSNQWYVELDDEDYARYEHNLKKRAMEVIRDLSDIGWEGAVNVQGNSQEPPDEGDNRLSLYVLDYDCKTTRGFKVLPSIASLMQRKIAFAFYGSTCESCGKKTLVILKWESMRREDEKGDS
ncbi:MAG: hypothetical protein ACXQT3_06280 [Methermicoccaceae archaeon]